MNKAPQATGTLLTRGWRDTPEGLVLTLWAATKNGPLRIVIDNQQPVCFIPRDALPGTDQAGAARRTSPTLRTLEGDPVDALHFRRQRDLLDAREQLRRRGIRPLEADIKPVDRYLMERFVTGALHASGTAVQRNGYMEMRNPTIRTTDHRADLTMASIDIETNGLDGELHSIGVHDASGARVFIAGHPDRTDWPDEVAVTSCADETEVMQRCFAYLRESDPDVLIGWNVVGFDLDYLNVRAARLGVIFDIGRGGERATVLRPESSQGVHVARVPGRVVLDGIDVLKAAFYSFENFGLETVARALLGEGKVPVSAETSSADQSPVSRVEAINKLYATDPVALVRYNARDCSLVTEIFAHAKLLDFALRRAELTGLQADRLGGSVAAFDFLYLPRLHRKGFVARDASDVPGDGVSPGGYVLDSKPGLYDGVLVLDFKSLYPSIIRTFMVDPLAMAVSALGEAPEDTPVVQGFEGASFAAELALLPDLVKTLWQVRDIAKRDRDAPLSQAVKILMNSFYGVLGANGCRFRDHRLTSSITRRGHEIIRDSREFILSQGLDVIYGDTDSLFVCTSDGASEADAMKTGSDLAVALNAYWTRRLEDEMDLESHLEVEFETLFLRFLMPTVRGEATGSKKKYAGLVRNSSGDTELVFKGLESVRSDWTPLARDFQRELYRRAFAREPVKEFVKETDAALLAGELDEQCIYAKRLRRDSGEYTKNVPPHVQAARLLDYPVKDIRYVITNEGPRPVEPNKPLPRPDYTHYRERQLAPAADTILGPLGLGYAAITDAQIELF